MVYTLNFKYQNEFFSHFYSAYRIYKAISNRRIVVVTPNMNITDLVN
jgi:hypothetical protein